MNSTALSHTMFQEVLFPQLDSAEQGKEPQNLLLQKVLRYEPDADLDVLTAPLVIFDFETTGLDSHQDEIIEIGAIRWSLQNGCEEEFSTLIRPQQMLEDHINKITGITAEMLQDAPPIQQVWRSFVDFVEGSILVAHNAEFDMSFVWSTGNKLGYQIFWPALCTLKLARSILPELPSKNLDTLARHYGLQFEARHRSLGDVKVTAAVLGQMLTSAQIPLKTWTDFNAFKVERK